jgi:hypothetical protein
MLRLSPAIAAIALFLAVNVSLLQLVGGSAAARFPSSAFNDRVSKFKQSATSPDIVLLGSSLMRSPFFYLDCRRGQDNVKLEQHLELKEFEDRLAAAGTPAHVFNLSNEGAMVTDNLLVFDRLLRQEKKPKLVIYGIAVRDFVDAMLAKETASDAYASLFDISEVTAFGNLFATKPLDQLELVLDNSLPLYAGRRGLQGRFAACFAAKDEADPRKTVIKPEQLVTPVVPGASTGLTGANEGLDPREAENSKLRATLVLARNQGADKLWTGSIQLYAYRYWSVANDKGRFERQMQALNQVLELGRKNDIPVLLVNMPVSQDSIDLLPPGFYDRYVQRIEAACNNRKASFLNLQQDNSYNRSCFHDIVHLNEIGGNKLCDRFVSWITAKQKTNGLVSNAGGM